MLKEPAEKPEVYASEVDLDSIGKKEALAIDVKKLDDKTYSVEGTKIEKMLGYTNLQAEKGFEFFQNFMEDQGVIKKLKKLGMKEGDTIKVYGHTFEYYDTEDYDDGDIPGGLEDEKEDRR